MVAKNRVAICSLISRADVPPKLVVLVPHIANPNEYGKASGFHCIFMPFAEDIRHVEAAEPTPRKIIN